MDIYLFTLVLSTGGLGWMALSGFGHHHAGPGRWAAPRGHGGHGSHGAARGGRTRLHLAKVPRGSHVGARPGLGSLLLGLLSPRVFLSVLLGFGATGMLVRPWLPGSPTLLLVLAAIGGWAFEQWAVSPLWDLLLGFASRPAETLETNSVTEGEAATDFDAAGHGLIAVQLDGQVCQVLGTLCAEERTGTQPWVRTGERLFIRAVNLRRNTCTVSRLGC